MTKTKEMPLDSFPWETLLSPEYTACVSTWPRCGIMDCYFCGEGWFIVQSTLEEKKNHINAFLIPHLRAVSLLRKVVGEESWEVGRYNSTFYVFNERLKRSFMVNRFGWCRELADRLEYNCYYYDNQNGSSGIPMKCFMFLLSQYVPGEDVGVASSFILKYGNDVLVDSYLNKGRKNQFFPDRISALPKNAVILY